MKKLPDSIPYFLAALLYYRRFLLAPFPRNLLSVLIPVSHNYHVRGYIAIHVPLSVLTHEKESYLLPYYITLIALAVLGLLFAAANWLIVYYPLRRLRKAAGDYAIEISRRPSLERDDELGYLAHTMDFMAGAFGIMMKTGGN